MYKDERDISEVQEILNNLTDAEMQQLQQAIAAYTDSGDDADE